MVESNADWIRITLASSGNGAVSFRVAPNESTAPRQGRMSICGRPFAVEQAGLPVRINSEVVSGKKLIVAGQNFAPGAVILINGQEQQTRNDSENPQSTLVGKKAGRKKKIKAGDKLRVRNLSGNVSEEFIFTGS
jgi:hypothetical protein